MKKILTHLLYTSIIIGVYSISALSSFAQTSKAAGYTAEEKKSIEIMKRDGASDEGIDQWIMQRRLASLEKKNTTSQNNISNQPPVVYANSCGDMGGENGWSNWKGRAGTIDPFGAVTWGAWSNPPPASNGNTAFVRTTGAGNDGCTPSPGNPVLPVVAPGFGKFSIRLGVLIEPNAFCEQISFPLNVTATDTNFIYTYAIVLDNPADGNHVGIMAPHAEIYILDTKGDTVPCSHQLYFGSNDNTLPAGFYQTNCNNGYSNAYKPWTTVGVNLNKYLGQSLSVVVSNYDCALGGHFCHSYWDFMCPPVSGSDPPYCQGDQTTLVGPPSDPGNPYTYQWYVNGASYTGLPNSTSVSITPTPKVGDLYAIHVHQKSGCDFWVPFRPQPMSINPGFTFIGGCGGIVNFTDKSTTPDGSPIVAWNWNFGGGTPNTSTAQNPMGIAYPLGGTYSVTLIATSAAGCVDTIVLPLTIIPAPTAEFKSNVVCFNNPTLFNDLSTGLPAPTQWSWNFGDSNTSTAQNPTHTYGAPGSYMVTLIATDPNGCKDTIKHPVFINPLPVANFSSNKVCFGNPTCFTNLSTVSSGSITGLSWNFGDPNSGSNNISTLSAPCHTFTSVNNFKVTLTVTSDSGCQSTVVLPVAFSPPPVALFNSTPVCLNIPTSFVSNSTSSGTDPISTWNWSFGDGTSSTQTNPTHIYTTPGGFTATLVVTTVQGCKDTIDNPVTVYAPPVANFAKPDSGCSPVYGNYMDLSASADGTVNRWQWSFPGGSPSSSTLQNPKNIKYTVAGSYSVSLIVTTTNGCIDSIQLPMIDVYSWPTAEFDVAPTVALSTDPVFNFSDGWSNNVAKWWWNFGDSSPVDSINTDPSHSYSATVTNNDFYSKQICIHVETVHGCYADICHEVKLIPEFTFYIPNTFTPNGDGTNEMFYGKCRGVKEYDIWVFDRWGNQVWDCHHDDRNINWDSDLTNPKQEGLASYCKWDGIVVQGGLDMGGNSRQLAQEDVYVWKVHLIDIFNKRHTYIGHVNIVK